MSATKDHVITQLNAELAQREVLRTWAYYARVADDPDSSPEQLEAALAEYIVAINDRDAGGAE